jgi:hypothetical protein
VAGFALRLVFLEPNVCHVTLLVFSTMPRVEDEPWYQQWREAHQAKFFAALIGATALIGVGRRGRSSNLLSQSSICCI